MLSDTANSLAVVPVFVNTGAALLPALIAGLTSFVAILFKPKLLIRTCREKPYRPIGIVVAGVAIYFGIGWFTAAPADTASATPAGMIAATGPQMMQSDDWVRLAHKLANDPNSPAWPRAGSPLLTGTAPAAPASSNGTPTTATGKANYLSGGPTRSGYLGGPVPHELTKLWTHAEEGVMFVSTPLVANGKVYGAGCILDPPDSYGFVICLDANTGQQLWLTEKNGSDDFKGFFSSPAITADGKSLVIGQGLHQDYDSELICLDAGTGRVKWVIPSLLHIESSPAIEGDIVVVGAGAVEDASHHPAASSDPAKDKNPGYVLAARISTGKVLWKHVVNDPESSPAMADGVAYIGSGFNGNAVVALRLDKTDDELKAAGLTREMWKTQTPFPATGAITIAGDLVLVGCGNGDYVYQAPDPAGAVIALDRKTGEVRWKLDMPDGVLGPIAVHGRVAIAPVRNGQVVAIEFPDPGGQPKVLWDSTAHEGGRTLAGCALAGDRVFAVTHNGYLVAMDGKTGKVLETLYINSAPGEQGMSIASPLVANGRVYIGSETGGLRCYGESSNGK